MFRLTRLCLERPRAACTTLLAITLFLALGLPAVRPEFGYRVLIGDDHPAVRRLDAFIERFGGGLPIQIGWECGPGLPCEQVFDRESLEMAQEIGDALRSAEGVSSVMGPANAPLLVPDTNGFALRRFVERGEPAADAAGLARLAVRDPLWRGVLVAPDATAAVIIVQPVDSSDGTSLQVAAAVDRALEAPRARGHRFHLTGDPIQNLIVGRDLAESTTRLIPFTVAVVGLILFALSRTLRTSAIALATLGVALAWTFGLLGWLGWPQDGILEVLAPLILVVGVCDAVHLLAKHADLLAAAPSRDDDARRRALLEATRRVSGPCLVTSLTTAAAFLSFTTSDLATFHRFGTIAAFGTLACLVLTFSLLPLLVQWLPDPGARLTPVSRAWRVGLEAVLATSERRARPILIASLALLVVCGAGWWLYLQVDHEWKESLGEHSRVVQSWRFMEERIGRSDTLELEVVLPDGAPLESPRTLSRLRDFAEGLTGVESLGSPRSIVDVIERVNQLLHGDDRAWRRVGDSAAANAEILELVGFDDPDLLARWVSFDRSRLRLSLGAPEQAFSTRRRVLRTIELLARERLPADWKLLPTGRVAMQFSWIQDVQSTQLRSFPTALTLVFGMLVLFFRRLPLAIAALVPTLLPIVITLGAMGWSGMTLDVGRAMIAAILIGIGVDDSIHVLDRYRQRRRAGDDPRRAIREAILHTGRAVVTTSLALALGFLTLMASAWQSIASFGFLAAVAIGMALAATLFVLPALVFACAPTREGPKRGGRGALRAAVVALPVLLCLGHAAQLAMRDERPWTLPCWLLPQGHVVTAPGSQACPLRLLDEITWVADAGGVPVPAETGAEIRSALATAGPVATVGVRRRGDERSARLALQRNGIGARAARWAVALLLAGSLLVLPALLLARSRSRSAVALGIFYSAIGVVLVPVLAGSQSPALDRAVVLAAGVAPAALIHLAMVFPAESRMVRLAPRLQALPYAVSVVLGGIALLALDRSPLLWPSFVHLLLALDGVAWLVLLCSCGFAAREADTPWARTQARFVLAAGLLLPAGVSVAVGGEGSVADHAAAYLAASAVTVPLPIGLAIGRYNLFDLGWRARRAAARVVYLVFGAFAVATGIRAGARLLDASATPELAASVAAALVCLAAAEALRQPILGLLDAAFSPRAEELRALRDARIDELSRLGDEGEIGRRLLDAVGEGLRSPSSALALRLGRSWESIAGCPASSELLEGTSRRLAERPLLQLADEPPGPARASLAADGVSLVAALRHGEDLLGLLLVRDASGGAPRPAFELDFVAALCSQAAIGIHRSRLVDERAAIERHAATARVAVDLMHDIGKDLGWMRGLASRLARRAPSDPALRNAAKEVDALAEDLSRRLRAFVEDASARSSEPPGIARLDELLERAIHALDRGPEDPAIRLARDPTLRAVRCPEGLRRSLTRSLGQALAGLPVGPPVCIRAALVEGGQLQVVVTGAGGDEQASLRLPIPEPGPCA